MTATITRVLMMKKHHELYVIVFDDAHREHAFQHLGCMASNADLSFDWSDAAFGAKWIRIISPPVCA
jgi:hypothetical protein